MTIIKQKRREEKKNQIHYNSITCYFMCFFFLILFSKSIGIFLYKGVYIPYKHIFIKFKYFRLYRLTRTNENDGIIVVLYEI